MVPMRRLLILLLVPWLLSADDQWTSFASGPFVVLTDAGARAGRETLLRLEEFRHALGQVVGEQDLETPEPIRVLLFKNAKGWATAQPLVEGRAGYFVVLPANAPVPAGVHRALTRLFLESNTARMPEDFERGLVDFFSTLEVTGIRITAGRPPEAPNLDWARVHLLVVDPEYFGKLRVLLFNLRKGVDPEPAYRNAFGKAPAAIETQAKSHLAAGNFQTTQLSSRALSQSDFGERQISDSDARLARADLLAGPQSAAEYEALLRAKAHVAEAEEGLGLLALRDRRPDDARRRFEAAIAAGSASARCYLEYARLEPDNEKATQALLKAAGVNPKLDEPFALMAQRDTDPRKRLAHWKAAAERDPRNASYWQALAEGYLSEHDYAAAAKAWTSGEQAATDPAQRATMRQARLAVEQQRLDYEAAERQRATDEQNREIERLKAEARAEVRALEEKYNEGKPGEPQAGPAVAWWDGPRPTGKAHGSLKQVDCLGKQARLLVEGDDRATVKLLVTDPAKIMILGGGEHTLGCGPQKSRRVVVEYFPKPDAKLATAGEVATIEFQ